MQCFLGDPDSGKLHLETHRLMLAIAKKTLDENRFTANQKTTFRNNPTFKVGDHVYFKNKQPGKWDLKWRPGYWIVRIECNGHYIHIENQATGRTQSCNIMDIILEPPIKFWEHWHPVWQSQLLYQSPVKFTYDPTQRYPKLVFSSHLITLHQPCFSSTLEPSTHIHPCYNHPTDGTRRISYLPTCITGIPYQALLDRHCTYITWKSGMPPEDLQKATH